MQTMDFSPLYRSVVGFDRLAELLDAATPERTEGFPPYNIERVEENAYRVEIAVAGFKREELTVEVKENMLLVTGSKMPGGERREFVHRGMDKRDFDRQFQLADYMVVTEARLEDGLLSISLQRQLPEALKPRRIMIDNGSTTIEGKTTSSLRPRQRECIGRLVATPRRLAQPHHYAPDAAHASGVCWSRQQLHNRLTVRTVGRASRGPSRGLDMSPGYRRGRGSPRR